MHRPSIPHPTPVLEDVDGTLLDGQQEMPRRVQEALNSAVDSGVQVRVCCVCHERTHAPPTHWPLHCPSRPLAVPLAQVILATGKARGPWFRELLPRLNMCSPSIFLQGAFAPPWGLGRQRTY